MASKSKIQWTDRTWNPVRGCSKVSPGCANCYAITQALRFSKRGQPYEGLVKSNPPNWTGRVRCLPEKLGDPLRWRKSAMVFVNSMSDLFHEDVPDTFIDRVFATMGVAHWHTFQVVTKRADRMAAYFAETWQVPAKPAERVYDIDVPAQAAYVQDRWERINKACDDIPTELLGARCWDEQDGLIGRPAWPRKPYPNVWLLVSVENQETANKRLPELLKTPAAVRGVSYEPALGPVDFGPWLPGLDWIIVGGESGPNAREFSVNYARSTRDQCRAAGVAFYMKQMGASVLDVVARHANPWPQGEERWWSHTGAPWERGPILRDKKGGNPREWPEDLRIREYPKPVEVAV